MEIIKYFSIYETFYVIKGEEVQCWEVYNPLDGQIFIRMFKDNNLSRILENNILPRTMITEYFQDETGKSVASVEWIPDAYNPMYSKIWNLIENISNRKDFTVVYKVLDNLELESLCYIKSPIVKNSGHHLIENESIIKAAERSRIIDKLIN